MEILSMTRNSSQLSHAQSCAGRSAHSNRLLSSEPPQINPISHLNQVNIRVFALQRLQCKVQFESIGDQGSSLKINFKSAVRALTSVGTNVCRLIKKVDGF